MQDIVYTHTAQYYETDQMGIIHHSNYIRWMEEARIDFLEKIGFGYTRIEDGGVYVAVIGVNCEYKSMVRFGEKVDIRCTVTQCSAVRMAVAYTMTDAETGALRLTGETRHAFINAEGRPVRLQKALPELHAIFQQYIQ